MDSHKCSTEVERLEVIETGRRRRWSDDEKLRIVLESLQTPRAISSTARRHGISRSLLVTWRRSFRPEATCPGAQHAGFVPVTVVAGAESAPTMDATPASGRMVIVVSEDRRVIVDTSVDASALARVLQVLERR
jgi:transposase